MSIYQVDHFVQMKHLLQLTSERSVREPAPLIQLTWHQRVVTSASISPFS